MKFIQCDHCDDSRPRTDQTRGKRLKKKSLVQVVLVWLFGCEADRRQVRLSCSAFTTFDSSSSSSFYFQFGAKIDPSCYLSNLWKIFSQSRCSCNSSSALLELVLQLRVVPVLDVGAPPDGLISTASSVQQPTTSLVPCRKHFSPQSGSPSHLLIEVGGEPDFFHPCQIELELESL